MSQSDRPVIRAMRPADAADIIDMACDLAAAVGDGEPALSAPDLVRDGCGKDRWFDCLVAELPPGLAGYALMCKGFEAHTGKRRLWLGDFYVRPTARHSRVGSALMAAVASHALSLGCDAVYWELWRMNVQGAAFYRRFRAEEDAELAVMSLGKDRLTAITGGR